jgi:hypothetical protein
MSYKEPFTIVEITQPHCSLVYGTGDCTAEKGVTGSDKCYNTRATCQDPANYDEDLITLRFGTGNARLAGYYIMPFVKKVSLSPVIINAGGASSDLSPLGKRATATISMEDPPHSDFMVDDYIADREFSPIERSTFWRKWVKRNPYYRYTEIKVLQGFVGDDYEELEVRTYLIDKINIANNGVTITAKDPLVLVANKQSQAPAATGGILTADLNDSAVTFIIEGALDGEYPTAGILRINDEVLTYTGISQTEDEVTFTGVTRGQYGTEAVEHEAEDRVQLCLKYTEELIHDIIYDLMINYASVPEEYINYAEWKEESETYLSLYILTSLITEPTGVDSLIGELLESTLAYVYWDETEALLKLKAYRPPITTPNTITEKKDILKDSITVEDYPDSRINQVWLFWGQKDPTEKLTTEKNFSRLRVRVLGEDYFQDRHVRKIYSRWLQDDAQALDITSQLLSRFQNPPRRITAALLSNDMFKPGNYVTVETKKIVDEYGLPQPVACEIVSAQKEETIIKYLLQSYRFITPAIVPVPDNMIILALNGLYGYQLYDGTNGTIDLIGKYLKCSDEQGGTGGSETHQHSLYSGNSGKNPLVHFRSYPDNFYGGRDHTHSINHLHAAVENNHPHVQVIPYVPDEYSVLQASMLMFYCGGNAPDGWEIKIDLINKYIKCGLSYSAAGGSAAHQHFHTGNSGATTPDHYAFGAVDNDECSDDNSHTHSIAHVHELLNNLIYIGVIPVTISTAEEIPSGMCAFFIGDVPPAGWSVYSAANGRFIKLAETSGGTGGSTTHSHDDSFTTGPGGGKEDDGYKDGMPIGNVGLPSHAHSMDHTHDEQDWQPPFQELMFCRKDIES